VRAIDTAISPALVAILIASTALGMVSGALQTPQPGEWSAGASYLWPGPTVLADYPEGGRNLSVLSPDGKLMIAVVNTELNVRRTADGRSLTKEPIGVSSLAEVLWAPDSSAFFLTESEGGWVGQWLLTIYRITHDGLMLFEPSKPAIADFRRRVKNGSTRYPDFCPEGEPNVPGVAWLDGSKRLLLVVEWACHSPCDDMCRKLGYLVNPISGAILERFTEKEMKTRWKQVLGPRLLGEW
jgi:hypothetical protein